ncbi:hypothetical protein CANARDRAFT_27667 [[Candida] arabinofermentans NRRL YB-2248]|uniref:DWNN domain-containing protein n=1 Tax=[Candida] arabinofermentans NRRL YB-2248 TaxID=983967 RepID=A0A1E4T400_9ASCO|nr:hypothetical protein CANARDRAFT_27667 [[Candida] arabinofermentans NRRL YB-2248]
MAVIYYRFKSQREDQMSTIKFDGTGLTVFELKKEVIQANRLTNSLDTDIFLYHAEDLDKEYDDDNEVIQRSSTVIARRTAAPRKGRGNTQRYIAGKPRVAKNFTESTMSQSAPIISGNARITTGKESEDDMIKQMFNQQDDQWSQQQAVLATAQRIDSSRQSNKLDENIPEYYICYKCGEKGKHHIKNCPKNNDPNWEGIRVKKTTGIPKSHLKTIDNPTDITADSNMNYMINEEGKYVVAVADTKAWAHYQEIQKSKQQGHESDNLKVDDPILQDPQTGKIWKDPVKTKCCEKLYSRTYIEDALLESDFKCPNCGQEDVYLDSLEPDIELQQKVEKYISEHKRKLSPTTEEDQPAKKQKPNGLPPTPVSQQQQQQQQIPVMPPMMPFMPFGAPMQMGMPMMNNLGPNNNQNGGQPK